MTLARYILRRFLTALLAVQLVIAAIVLLFSGVENLRRFDDNGATLGDVLAITLLGAPEILYQVFPLVLMLASLAAFLALARSSELVVLRAAGISALRLLSIPVAAAIVLGGLFVSAVNPVVSATMKRGVAVEDRFRGAGPSSRLSVSPEGLWLRQGSGEGQAVIQAARANADGTRLTGVTLHQFDETGALTARIEAPRAALAPGAWRLADATRWEARPGQGFVPVATASELTLPTELTSAQILDSFSAPEMISFWQLRGFIARLEAAGFSGLRHRLFFQSEIAKPAFFAAMVLIGAAFALRPARFGQTGIMVLLAVLAGFSLYFIKDFAETLGANGEIPLHVAAWTPPVAAILLALGLLLHLEDG